MESVVRAIFKSVFAGGKSSKALIFYKALADL
jgi:hypothetical protein